MRTCAEYGFGELRRHGSFEPDEGGFFVRIFNAVRREPKTPPNKFLQTVPFSNSHSEAAHRSVSPRANTECGTIIKIRETDKMNTNDSFNQTKPSPHALSACIRTVFKSHWIQRSGRRRNMMRCLPDGCFIAAKFPLWVIILRRSLKHPPSESLSVMRELFRYCRAKV